MEKTVIKFGTDGFRGIIAREFTFETVERIINAIYTLKQELDITNVHVYVIGYGEYKEKLLSEIIRLNLTENIDIIESNKGKGELNNE